MSLLHFLKRLIPSGVRRRLKAFLRWASGVAELSSALESRLKQLEHRADCLENGAGALDRRARELEGRATHLTDTTTAMYNYWESRVDTIYGNILQRTNFLGFGSRAQDSSNPSNTIRLTVHDPCPVCSAATEANIWVSGLTYRTCTNCKLIFSVSEQGAEKYDAEFYRSEKYAAEEDLWPREERVELFKTLLRAGQTALHNESPSILDFGSGVKDLDIKAQLAPTIKFYDPSFDDSRLSKQEDVLGRKFDLVLCTEVLEHVLDQRSLFKSLADVLSPDGIILATSLLHDYKFTISYLNPAAGHILIHSKTSLGLAARNAGMSVELKHFSGQREGYYFELRKAKQIP